MYPLLKPDVSRNTKDRVLIMIQMMLATGLNTASIYIIEEKANKIQNNIGGTYPEKKRLNQKLLAEFSS